MYEGETPTLEARVAYLEEVVGEMRQADRNTTSAQKADPQWWERIFGTFADSEGFEEATRLGREYRESLHENHEKDDFAE